MLHQVFLTFRSALHSPRARRRSWFAARGHYCARLEIILACQCLVPEVPFSLHSGHLATQGRRQACGAHHGHQDYPCEGETSQVARIRDSECALSSPKDRCPTMYASDTTIINLTVLECHRRHLTSSHSRSVSKSESRPKLTDAVTVAGCEPSDAILPTCVNLSSTITTNAACNRDSCKLPDANLCTDLALSTTSSTD